LHVSKKISNESNQSNLTYESLKNKSQNELKKVGSVQNLKDIQQESLVTIKLDQRMSSSKDDYNNVRMHSLNKNNSNGKSDPNV
jgi:hypothetical protein